MCYTPELAAEVTLQPITRFHMDAAILFSDILVIPDALGAKVAFEEGKGPLVETITTEEELKKLSVSQVLSFLSPVFEAIAKIKSKLPSDVALIGFAGSPWTVATYMVEGKTSKNFEKVRQLAYKDPVFFEKLIGILVEATSLYLIEQIKTGAEIVQLFDSWSGILPENQFERWVIQPTKQVVANVKKVFPDIPIIGFPKGAGIQSLAYIEKTGVDALGVDYTQPLDWVKKSLQTRLPVQGNLDPVLLATDEKAMEFQVKQILDTLAPGKFIFNLGHGILPHTPISHVEKLVKLVREWQAND